MGKLTNMVAEESSFGNRVKYNARRIRFAGIGLFGKLDQERTRIYQQIADKGNANESDGIVASMNAFGTGVVSLAREESQRIFDELVEAGETIVKKGGSKPAPKAAPKAVEIAKEDAPKKAKPVLKAVESTPVKKVAAKKAVKKPAAGSAAKPATRKKAAEVVAEELLLAFGDAKSKVSKLTSAPAPAAQLELYALFKQGEEGDVTGRRPAMAKVQERAKFDARREIKGMSKAEAIDKYIAKVNSLV